MLSDWKWGLLLGFSRSCNPFDYFILFAIYSLVNAVYFERPVSELEFGVCLVITTLAQAFVGYQRRKHRITHLWIDLDDFMSQ